MRRFLNWVIWLPLAVIAIGFAIANRQWVTLSFDPFSRDAPFAAIDMPLWALVFLGCFIGLAFGWSGAWLAQGKWRRAAREARIEVLREQREIEQLRRESRSRQLTPTGDVPT